MMFLNSRGGLWFLLPLIYLVLAAWGRSRQKGYIKTMTGRSSLCLLTSARMLLFLGLCLLVPALMRPVSNPRLKTTEQEGRNIVFVVDVSKSMLAEDLVPNRLERARYDILNSLGDLAGNRVALVAFSGFPVLKCPLTMDYSYFASAVEELGPSSVSRGGTNLGDAVRVVMDNLFDPEDRKAMDIILITDGEDQGSFPVESASRAGKEGVRIIAIGLGDQEAGVSLPTDESVISKADMKTLRAMANASRDGWAVEVQRGKVPIGRILQNIRMRGEAAVKGKTGAYSYDEHYRWFLVPGIILIMLSLLWETGILQRRRR